ncbi:MAG TPA: hypothetical protein V6D18_15465 [Thermosynechococcaceae cyanobacterium]
MNRKSIDRRSQSTRRLDRGAPLNRRDSGSFPRESLSQKWNELRTSYPEESGALNEFTRLIERNAPLQTHTALVLMYGPFQAEMQSDKEIGVASWLRECVSRHGLPSLVRFDYRRRAQIFRRDQLQSWLEPMTSKLS